MNIVAGEGKTARNFGPTLQAHGRVASLVARIVGASRVSPGEERSRLREECVGEGGGGLLPRRL